MDLRQQIVEDRVEQVATLLGISLDEAFLRFAHSLIVGHSLHAFDQDDMVEGGQNTVGSSSLATIGSMLDLSQPVRMERPWLNLWIA